MKFFKVVFASALGYLLVVVVFFLISVLIIAGLSNLGGSDQVEVKDNTVLHLKFNYPIKDHIVEENPFEALNTGNGVSGPKGLDMILDNIDKAKEDESVKGIFLDLTFVDAGMAKLEEIRNALLDFKSTGKFIHAYSEVYYNSTYYLASVADKVYLNPSGEFFFNGMVADIAFFRDALDKLGIEMQVVRHGKFKGAVEPFVNDKLSDENRYQIQQYLNSIYGVMVDAIEQDRNIPRITILDVADKFTIRNPKGALKYGFVDSLVYKDAMNDLMAERLDLEDVKDLHFVTLDKYNKVKVKGGKKDGRIAVVYAQGNIVSGRGQSDEIGSESLVETLHKVRKSKRIDAVVLRIDSRGGSALASEIILREARLLAQDKPLIVSMGDVAASGGYYIAMAADTIVALPSTITGSIGVFGLIPNAGEMFNENLGIHFDYVKTGEMADFGRIDRPMTTKEREILQGMIEEIYDQFITRVSDGRNIPKDQVDSLGQGRVYTGTMAGDNGLVDILGGLDSALSIAAYKSGLNEFKVVRYPKKVNPFEQALKSLGEAKLNAKEDVLKEELGTLYPVYESIRQAKNMKGAQMLMPYTIRLN
jgi:protease-4